MLDGKKLEVFVLFCFVVPKTCNPRGIHHYRAYIFQNVNVLFLLDKAYIMVQDFRFSWSSNDPNRGICICGKVGRRLTIRYKIKCKPFKLNLIILFGV